MKRKSSAAARPKMYDPESPESFVNGREHQEDYDNVCDTFLGGNYRDSDLDAVNSWLKSEEMAFA